MNCGCTRLYLGDTAGNIYDPSFRSVTVVNSSLCVAKLSEPDELCIKRIPPTFQYKPCSVATRGSTKNGFTESSLGSLDFRTNVFRMKVGP